MGVNGQSIESTIDKSVQMFYNDPTLIAQKDEQHEKAESAGADFRRRIRWTVRDPSCWKLQSPSRAGLCWSDTVRASWRR
jgi:hypothetical protein